MDAKIFWKVLFIVIFYSCSFSKKNENQLSSLKIMLTDTIRVDVLGNYRIKDYDPPTKHFLAFDSRTGNILIFDRKGTIVSTFDRSGDSPEGFGDYIIGAGFYKKNQIAVVSRRGVFFYDYQGSLMRKIKRPLNKSGIAYSNFQGKVTFFNVKKTEYMACTLENPAIEVDKTSKEYYQKSEVLTLVNLDTEQFQTCVRYPDNTIYRGELCFYDVDLPIFTYSRRDSNFYFVFGFEASLHYLDGSNLTQLRPFADLSPTQMNILEGENFEKYPPSDKVISYQYLSGQYYDIFAKGDSLITVYVAGIPKSKISSKPTFQEYFKLFQKYSKSYIQLIVRGSKRCQDIPLPPEVSALHCVLPNGDLIMPYNKYYADEEKNYELFYVGKLVKD